MMWLGCTGCGGVTRYADGSGCACGTPVRVLDGVAEKLEFKLTMAERADEAAAVARGAEEMRRLARWMP